MCSIVYRWKNYTSKVDVQFHLKCFKSASAWDFVHPKITLTQTSETRFSTSYWQTNKQKGMFWDSGLELFNWSYLTGRNFPNVFESFGQIKAKIASSFEIFPEYIQTYYYKSYKCM